MLIYVAVLLFATGAAGFVGLNEPCAGSLECIGGTICANRFCQCPPVYLAAGIGCVQAPTPFGAAPLVPAPLPAARFAYAPEMYPAQPLHQFLPPFQAQSWSLLRPDQFLVQAAAPVEIKAPLPIANAVVKSFTEYWAYPGASCVQSSVCVGNSFCYSGVCACPVNYALSGKICSLVVANATESNETTTVTPVVNITTTTHAPVPVKVPAVAVESLLEKLKGAESNFDANPSKLVELRAAPLFSSVQFAPAPLFQAPAIPMAPAAPLVAPLVPAAAPVVRTAPVVPFFNPLPLSTFTNVHLGQYPMPSYFAKSPSNFNGYLHRPSKASFYQPAAAPFFSYQSHPFFSSAANIYTNVVPFNKKS